MIVGDGMIARACKPIDRDDVVFFASGVSDSKETDVKAFERERKLLEKTIIKNKDKVIVYFGTDTRGDSPYESHKRNMCEMVEAANNNMIVRVSQVVGNGGNGVTLFNYLYTALRQGETIRAYPVERSLIDVDDLTKIVSVLLSMDKRGVYDLFQIEPLLVYDIILMMADSMKVQASIDAVEGQIRRVLPNSHLIDEIIFPIKSNYTRRLISKYITNDRDA